MSAIATGTAEAGKADSGRRSTIESKNKATTTTEAPVATTTTEAQVTTTTIGGAPASDPEGPSTEPGVGGEDPVRVYAYYYSWWSESHWRNRLGVNYPHGAVPLPLPATLDPDGCGAVSLYEGNGLFDVPAGSLYDQSTPGVIEGHVRQAAAAGITGFLVNWKGTGDPNQKITDTGYTRRLALAIEAANTVAAEGVDFAIAIHYAGSHEPTVDHMLGDWSFLARTFADDPVLDRHYSPRPMLVWSGSRYYDDATIAAVSTAFRDTFFLVGTETRHSWTPERAAHLDGATNYWSSQNPYTNPRSFDQLAIQADAVRASGLNPDGSQKLWFAPFAPGYNHTLRGGTSCVPRHDGETMRILFEGNARTNPDGFFLISWNEISEGTFVEPLTRWGDQYLREVSELIAGASR